MFEEIKGFFVETIENGFDVDKFLGLINTLLNTIFAFIKKEEEIK
jgi:hypothetical protein